jgi:transcriptional regulator with XRE-family HTH domain
VTRNVTTQFTNNHGRLLLTVAMDPREVGRRIKEARERRGWTQLYFATEVASVSPSSVARWESGKLPPIRELMRLADLLDVPVEELVEPSVGDSEETRLRQAVRAELAEIRELLESLLSRLPPPPGERQVV